MPMSAEKKITGSIPFWAAITCCTIIGALLAFSVFAGSPGTEPRTPAQSSGTIGYGSPWHAPGALPSGVCLPVLLPIPSAPVVPEMLAGSALVLTRPPADALVPYTMRGFSRPVEASVAWWMYPGFDSENREFRRFLRSTQEEELQYPEEERIFFHDVAGNLDAAEERSTLSDNVTLYRGITPGVAGIVLNSSAWTELPFSSTSYDITVTLDPYGTRDPGGYLNVLVLPRQKGDHALYLNEDQREFLLPRGTAWKVTKAVNVRDLDVTAGFPLHNRTENSASFSDVRLIYLADKNCA